MAFVVTSATSGTSSDLPALLAFAGAIIVAAIAALTAHVRQERSLAAESLRESKRLEHERHLLDVAELRLLLDEAAQVIWRLLGDLHDWSGSINRMKPSGTEWTSDRVKEVTESRRTLWDRLEGEYKPLVNRLAIRLGRDHPLVDRLFSLNDIFFAANGVFEMRGEAREDVGVQAAEIQQAAETGWAEMVRQSCALIGSKVEIA